MDPEEERVLYLSRVGRNKIFKYGTYNMAVEREITQDHPYYEKRDVTPVKVSYIGPGGVPDATQAPPAQDMAAPETAPPPPPPESETDPEALAAQVISSNFKVGLSQEEVDALLNGMP